MPNSVADAETPALSQQMKKWKRQDWKRRMPKTGQIKAEPFVIATLIQALAQRRTGLIVAKEDEYFYKEKKFSNELDIQKTLGRI